ncbi:MAG: ABC transporter ATP-binding protein [Candidatus Dormibacteria bacterium]
MSEVLRAEGLRRTFGGIEALRDASLSVRSGEVVGLVGPNGSGKSTLVNIVSGIHGADAGSVHLDGRPILRLGQAAIARRGVARTYQTLRLFRGLSVLENAMAATPRAARLGLAASLLLPPLAWRDRRRWEGQAATALERVGILHLARRPAGILSHGDQRRLELARAIAASPRVILLDEPVAGLGASERDLITELVRCLAADGTAVVIIEHNLAVILAVAHRVVVLDAGSVLSQGPPDRVFAEEAVRTAFVGGDATAA